MTQKIEQLNLSAFGKQHEETFFANADLFIAMNARDFGLKYLRCDQPYRVEEGRVMLVTQGWVRAVINLNEERIERQSLIVLVPDSIFEIVECSPDFDMKAFTFKELPISPSLSRQCKIALDDEEWQLVEEYVDIMWREVHRQPIITEGIVHLQTALLLELMRIAERDESKQQMAATRKDKIFKRFIDLVNQHGNDERRIEFYADQLCITPNHLGAVIKSASGLTVMQWLNRHTIQQAKVMLRYSDLPICEISEKLNFVNPSFFSKYFKKETSMTPNEYRNNKN